MFAVSRGVASVSMQGHRPLGGVWRAPGCQVRPFERVRFYEDSSVKRRHSRRHLHV